ncbi:FHA domain-containing protein [bacterium]|nr:FHA domain-containing protein [bacterium]
MGRYSKKIQSETESVSKVAFSFTEGQYSGGKFFLPRAKLFVIGRDPNSDVAVVETKVSRKHAKLWEQDSHVFIEDLGSTNGTFLNGKRLDKNIPVSLRKGDVLTVGDTSFVLETELGTSTSDAIILGHSAPAPGVTMESGDLVIEEEDDSNEILSSSDAIMSELLQDDSNEQHEVESEVEIDEIDDIAIDDGVSDLLGMDSDDEIGDLMSGMAEAVPQKTSQTAPQVLGKVGLAKQTAHLAQANKPLINLNRSGETKGNLREFFINELLEFLAQAPSAGTLKVSVTAPFQETIRLDIAGKGISSASSLSHQNFGDEKSFTRLMLARDAEWSFMASIEAQAYKVNKYLEDIQMEIAGTKELLTRYRKLISANQLKFVIPMTGKLSDLSGSDLETIQMMVNSQEVCVYLNGFYDLDDFMLLSEVIKYIDLGILFGDNNDEG